MTDLAKFRTLLEEFGLVHTVKYLEDGNTKVTIEVADIKTVWLFDIDCKFIFVGAE